MQTDEVTTEGGKTVLRQADGRSVEEHLADASIQAKVQLAIADDDALSTLAIDVEVQSGQVLLTGNVDSRAQWQQAAELAGSVEGATDIINKLRVDGQPVVRPSDEEPLIAGNAPSDTSAPAPDAPGEPARGDVASSGQTSGEESSASGQDGQPSDASPEQPSEPAAQQEVYHTVQSGESLWLIANEYDVSISSIRSLNDLSGNRLMPGQRLRVK